LRSGKKKKKGSFTEQTRSRLATAGRLAFPRKRNVRVRNGPKKKNQRRRNPPQRRKGTDSRRKGKHCQAPQAATAKKKTVHKEESLVLPTPGGTFRKKKKAGPAREDWGKKGEKGKNSHRKKARTRILAEWEEKKAGICAKKGKLRKKNPERRAEARGKRGFRGGRSKKAACLTSKKKKKGGKISEKKNAKKNRASTGNRRGGKKVARFGGKKKKHSQNLLKGWIQEKAEKQKGRFLLDGRPGDFSRKKKTKDGPRRKKKTQKTHRYRKKEKDRR